MSRGNSPFKKENVCTLGGFWNQEKMTQKRSPECVCVCVCVCGFLDTDSQEGMRGLEQELDEAGHGAQ